MSQAEQFAARWHAVVENGDMQGLRALLDDSVVFHSPVVHTPQEGPDLAAWYLGAAYQVLVNSSFRYVRKAHQGLLSVLEFEATVDDVDINAVDMIQWNEQGKIVDFKVMIRPLKAVNLLHQKMAEMLKQLSSN